MTDIPVPDAAVQIAAAAIGYETHGPPVARDIVTALTRAGWLHDPSEVTALRADNAKLRGGLRRTHDEIEHLRSHLAATRRRIDADRAKLAALRAVADAAGRIAPAQQ